MTDFFRKDEGSRDVRSLQSLASMSIKTDLQVRAEYERCKKDYSHCALKVFLRKAESKILPR